MSEKGNGCKKIMNQQKLTEKGAKMPKKEIDKYTFKICEAVKLGLDKFFLEENKPIKITEAHTDFAKRIIPTLPRTRTSQKGSFRHCRGAGCSKSTPGTLARDKPTDTALTA